MPQDHQDPTVCAVVQIVGCVYLSVVDHWNEEVRRDEHKSPAKIGRGYAENGKGMLV